MDDHHPEIVIIKRHSNHEEEHHGGAWKIAFADFMTAMMAFFLVLWILNATDKDTKTIIARYFNSVKLEDSSRARKGIREGAPSPGKESRADVDTNDFPPGPQTTRPKTDKSEAARAAQGAQSAGKDKTAGDSQAAQAAKAAKDAAQADPAQPVAKFSETALFKDPYASLDAIAGKPAPANAPTGLGVAEARADVDSFRDPFKPISRGSSGNEFADVNAPPSMKALASATTKTSASAPPAPPPAASGAKTAEPPAAPPAQSVAAAPPASAANASNVERKPPTDESPGAEAKPPSKPESAHGAMNAEAAKLSREIASAIRAETDSQPSPDVSVRVTKEGVLISLTDALDYSMFPVGSAEPQPKVVRIMDKIARSLKNRPGVIILRGYTDARPYRSATYDNWRLSSARAQMAHYMLVRGGVPEKRIERIEGYADRSLKTPGDPFAPENRRIEILLQPARP